MSVATSAGKHSRKREVNQDAGERYCEHRAAAHVLRMAQPLAGFDEQDASHHP
jgi:hypothetical protein